VKGGERRERERAMKLVCVELHVRKQRIEHASEGSSCSVLHLATVEEREGRLKEEKEEQRARATDERTRPSQIVQKVQIEPTKV
jgi:hypothetical protein